MSLSVAEQNYLKAIYHLSEHGRQEVSTNAIAALLQTKPASVSDMLRKLSEKMLVDYERYQGVNLTQEGKSNALQVIRNHRLWEVFLVEKLQFTWDEVHEVAEQLEHVHSSMLINRLDHFLGYPRFDPHGDPIPDETGQLKPIEHLLLADYPAGRHGTVLGVKESTAVFLKYLDKLGVRIGSPIEVLEKIEFDGSIEVRINNERIVNLSKETSQNIWLGN